MYDLNIAWSPSTTNEQLLQTLTLASTLGYATVALNHTLTLPFPANPVAPFPSASTLTSASSSPKKLPNILHRATLPLADPSAANYRLQSLVAAYDLLAVRPLDATAFQNACLTLDIPIISLDFSQTSSFYFKPKPCMAAVARGVRFEVCYSQALAADQRGRAAFIGNVSNLFRATRGRGIILSSEAKDALSLRAPADVVNLLNVWGLPNEKGVLGFESIPRSVVVNEGIKRSGFRGVINVVEVAERDQQDEGADDQGGKKTKNKGQNPNQKRKPGDEDSPQLSKRQIKKMKLASRGAASEKK
ncbi:RNase P subunit p30-domain-containing protein [Thelonectria olida]|uniref:RNase P subunit p30-domain-containing protein n=1 Tax=Thelonectria olida TaxID=1576542 RepID=A0A9P9AN11_9HYPO|nr:RNase P subunit p30-domain-containing protein [Thelonectria olida]